MEEKNKMLLIIRESEHEKSEESLKKTAELLGLDKEIQKENRVSSLWDEVLEGLRKEKHQLEEGRNKLQDKMEKLGNKGGILNKANQSTEEEIKNIEFRISKQRDKSKWKVDWKMICASWRTSS